MIAYLLSSILVLPVALLINLIIAIPLGLLLSWTGGKAVTTFLLGLEFGALIFFITKFLFNQLATPFNFIPLLIVGTEMTLSLLFNPTSRDMTKIMGIWIAMIILFILL